VAGKEVITMWFKKQYMEWDDYMRRIKFIDNFFFQQSVRNQNIRNS